MSDAKTYRHVDRIAELEAALRPFAEMARMCENFPDSASVVPVPGPADDDADRLFVRDLRTARTVLAKYK